MSKGKCLREWNHHKGDLWVGRQSQDAPRKNTGSSTIIKETRKRARHRGSHAKDTQGTQEVRFLKEKQTVGEVNTREAIIFFGILVGVLR